MKNILYTLILALLLPLTLIGQESDTTTFQKEIYPYKFPIWGQKVIDRGYHFPKPAGVGLNYVFNEMYLDITDFKMSIGGVPLEQLGVEELGFKKTRAYAHGGNFRFDLFVLPFLNIYGLASYSTGGTEVSLQPKIGGVTFPEFSSDVQFNAQTFGGGATFVYGFKKFFISADANLSSTNSALLDQSVGVITSSYRFGRRFEFKRGSKLAFYIGAMYRNFVNHEGNSGRVTLGEALPGLEGAIEDWYNGLKDWEQKIVDGIRDNFPSENIADVPISYFIKKDLIQKWTFQFGGNYEINDRWMVRGEYGVSNYSKFLMTGVNYRFGL